MHWAASTEQSDTRLLRLLLEHGADPNLGGGEPVDAFMGVPQTPLMLARRRGQTDRMSVLLAAGATNEFTDRVRTVAPPPRELPAQISESLIRNAVDQALRPLHAASIESKKTFLSHSSKQDCTPCHQQHLPMSAIGLARKFRAQVDPQAERELIEIVRGGEIKDPEVDWQPLFHPDPVPTKGYELLAYAGEDLPADNNSDAWVHHLSVIQGPDGRWFNNLPRPPIESSDIGATALAIHALQRYTLPGRRTQLAQQVDTRGNGSPRPRPRPWRAGFINCWACIGRVNRLISSSLSPGFCVSEQRADGGWAQLPTLQSDAFATGQAIYALRVAGGLKCSDPSIDRGVRYLLSTQLDDGTWHVARRAFPFQPTMDSGFPHGRNEWISAAATSWAVMALSVAGVEELVTDTRNIQSTERGS